LTYFLKVRGDEQLEMN